MPNTYSLISTIDVGSGGISTISFSSIPQTYTDILIVGSLRSTSASSNTGEYDPLGYQFNSSTSGYTTKNVQGNGATIGSSTQTTLTGFAGGTYGRITNGGINNSLSGANIFSSFSWYIPNYSGSANKSWSFDFSEERNNASTYTEIVGGLWSNTAAITSVSFALVLGNFAQYSSASLYGITKF